MNRRVFRLAVAALICWGFAPPAGAGESFPVKIYYKDRATNFESAEGRFKAKVQFRSQFRYSYSYDSAPRSAGQFDAGNVSTLRIRRGRLKASGYAYDPKIQYAFEYDWPTSTLLNSFVTIKHRDYARLRVGRWKVAFGRERVDSSSKQQFADRSIVNREFTIDRQQGVEVSGRVGKSSPLDWTYRAGVYSGSGLQANNDDDHMLWAAKLQWNAFGGEMKYSQSDIARTQSPALNIGFSGAYNQTNATRFSSSGAGSLDGFSIGNAGQFDVKQFAQDALFKWRGFSFQNEYHWKRVHNNVGALDTYMNGGYVQAGFFPAALVASLPEPLEFAVRYAYVDPDHSVGGDLRQAITAGLNWFFDGHANKLTLDVSHFAQNQPAGRTRREEQVRLQWDVSF
jgi:phosphate-selective porin